MSQLEVREASVWSDRKHENILRWMPAMTGPAVDLEQALGTVLDILRKCVPVRTAAIALTNGSSDRLAIRASHGLSRRARQKEAFRPDGSVTSLIFGSVRSIVVPDIGTEPLFLENGDLQSTSEDTTAFIGVPVLVHGSAAGVFSVELACDELLDLERNIRLVTSLGELVSRLLDISHMAKRREACLTASNLGLKSDFLEKRDSFLLGSMNDRMGEVRTRIEQVAAEETCVVIAGESGAGKTLAAQIIHELSGRGDSPFIKVPCTDLAPESDENTMSGVEPKAFTLAPKSSLRLLEQAGGGTLFLYHIAEMPEPLQARLLRFLHCRTTPFWESTTAGKVDVRIIASTNRDLSEAVSRGSLTSDLYDALNTVSIRIPPLRARRDEITSLIHFFSAKCRREHGADLRFTPRAMRALHRYSWPGNIRELESLVERLAVTAGKSDIDVRDLSPYMAVGYGDLGNSTANSLDSLKTMERRSVISALERNDWIQSRAARELGISLRQMGYRVKKYELGDLVKQKRGLRGA